MKNFWVPSDSQGRFVLKKSALSKVPGFLWTGPEWRLVCFWRIASFLREKTELHQANPTNIYSAYDSTDWKHVTCVCHENDARAHVWHHTPQCSMSNGDLILNTFGTRPRSQLAASFCCTRATLLFRLTDVVVIRNLTQTASTLQ